MHSLSQFHWIQSKHGVLSSVFLRYFWIKHWTIFLFSVFGLSCHLLHPVHFLLLFSLFVLAPISWVFYLHQWGLKQQNCSKNPVFSAHWVFSSLPLTVRVTTTLLVLCAGQFHFALWSWEISHFTPGIWATEIRGRQPCPQEAHSPEDKRDRQAKARQLNK